MSVKEFYCKGLSLFNFLLYIVPLSIPTLSGHISAIEWNKKHPSQRRILATHGWLDNAASFNELAPLLNAHVVAIDSAGHGQSSHRSIEGDYNIWEDAIDIARVADFLNWDSFELMGHSRGAGIATIYAGACPEKVEILYLIDGGIPKTFLDITAPKRLADIIKQRLNPVNSKASKFDTLEQAIMGRVNGMIPIPYFAAEHLAGRGVEQDESDKYYWVNDQRLKEKTFYLGQQQLEDFISAYQGRTEVFMAEEGIKVMYKNELNLLLSKNDANIHNLPGGHHLHMELEPARFIAEIVNNI